MKTQGVLTDVSGHWAKNSIQRLMELKAVTGNPDGTFMPDKPVSRGEFITMLTKALSLKGTSSRSFSDMGGHWAAAAVQAAVANGVTSGFEDGSFRPDDPITREQMAVMIAAAAKLTAVEESPAFADAEGISGWARDSVSRAVSRASSPGTPMAASDPRLLQQRQRRSP